MKIEAETIQNITLLTPITRRLDASVALRFKEEVISSIQQGNRQIVIDFTRVDFIDSSCLGALISILKSLSGDGQLILCALNANIKNMFALTRMDRVFTLCADRQEALGTFI